MASTSNVGRKDAIDFVELLNRVDGDRELLGELAAIFKDEFPRQTEALVKAVANKDCKQAAAVSHALKGMLSNLGATRAADRAGNLEQMGKSGQEAQLADELSAFERETEGLLAELESHLAGQA